MSETEKLFYELTKKFNGDLQWNHLDPMHQMQFIQAVNLIINICSARKENQNATN